MRPQQHIPDGLEMPDLYFQQTNEAEQARHREKLAQLSAGELLIDPIRDDQGGWHVEIVTMDWDEPGLLDRIFEAILRCINIKGGIAQHRTRIFTGLHGQVVNILELRDSKGALLTEESCREVLMRLREIRPGERRGVDTIEHLPFLSLIPDAPDYPLIDNERSERYTYIELEVERLSNRFTSVLLHTLARSELWLNIQVAEFIQGDRGRYCFYVVDKYGNKLRDNHLTRRSVVVALQDMNLMLLRFNARYIEREWLQRIDHNERTIYHSRPDPNDFLLDLESIRKLAVLKGFENRLSALVEGELLDSKAFFFLKKVQSFVRHNAPAFQEFREVTPNPEQIELSREYFELRRQALRIMAPLFAKLLEIDPINSHLSDRQRLYSMCEPLDHEGYALRQSFKLYPEGSIWMRDSTLSLDLFLLLARTGCPFEADTLETIEGALEGWTPQHQQEMRTELGRKFLNTLDESIRQGNTALVMRNMRNVGLLRRYVPGFDKIQGLIHVIADHSYTVDEHTFVTMEVLGGLKLLQDIFPAPGKSALRSDYEKIQDHVALRNYAQKYAVERLTLARITELRSDSAVMPFMQMMKQVQANNLEFITEMNFLEHGYTLCMGALTEIESVRRQLDPLITVYNDLPFTAQRSLMLCALFHDLKKPDQEHPALMADELQESLDTMGLDLPAEQVHDIQWLVRHHLDIRALMNRMGSEGEQVVIDFAQRAGNPELMRMLILFTYADRVAVHLNRNKITHDAMTLAEMLALLERA